MKVIKVLLISIICFICINCINIEHVYAQSGDLSISNIFNKANNFKGQASDVSGMSEGDLIDKFVPVGQILVIVANAVILIVVAIMGIKWITANPEQQGKLKQQLIGLVISIVVVYGAVGIWALIKGIMSGL